MKSRIANSAGRGVESDCVYCKEVDTKHGK